MSFTSVPLCGNSLVAGAFAYQWCNLQASGDKRICALQKAGESRHAALLQQGIHSSNLNDQLAKQRLRAEQRERQDDPQDGEDDPKCDDGEPYEWRRRSENVHCRSPIQTQTLDYRCRGWFRMGGPGWDRTSDQTIMRSRASTASSRRLAQAHRTQAI